MFDRQSLHTGTYLRHFDHLPPETVWSPDRIEASLDDFLARRPGQGDGPWIFGYGSLIWNPGFAVSDRRKGRAVGWHRQFDIHMDHFRGSAENPGLMLALAPGGACEGLILDIQPGTEADSMRAVLKRELVARELARNARWIEVETDLGPSEALTFYADPIDVPLTRLPLPDQARLLARANGAAGSGSEYLQRTAQGLAAAGIHDPYIWQLQDLVADEIESWPDEQG